MGGVIVEDVVTVDEDSERRCCMPEAIRCAALLAVGHVLREASSLLLRRSDIVGVVVEVASWDCN